jgi:CDP-diacylglycerol--glycerol-3-phosphate 3-phosphatidyltransferase
MNLANKLTILRILLVPLMVIIPFFNIQGNLWEIPITYIIIDIIFVIAALTDKLDGHIARSRNQITTFGKFLDPIADKIVVVTAMIMLVEFGHLPAWIPIIVILREFVVSGYRLIAVQKQGNVIAANMWGKLKTVTQMVAVALAFLDPNPFGTIFEGNLSGFPFVMNLLVTLLMSISVVATIFSGWEYLKGGKELFKNSL